MFEDCVDLINDFVVESRDGLEGIDNQLLEIEASGENIDTDIVNEVFRAIHSIKGASGFLGLNSVGRLAHSLENILDLLRNGHFKIDAQRVGVMLSAIDKLRFLIENVHTSNEQDVSHEIAQLERLTSGEAESTPVEPALEVEQTSCCTHEEFQTATENGQQIYEITFDLFENTQSNSDLTDFIERLGDLGTVLGGYLDSAALMNWDTHENEFPLPWTVSLATQLDRESLAGFFMLPVEKVKSVQQGVELQVEPSPLEDNTPVSEAGNSPEDHQIDVPSPTEIVHKTPAKVQPVSVPPAAESSIRVSVTVLNRLMNLVGELVLGRNQLLQTIGSENDRVLLSVASRIDQVTSEVQEAVMKTRLQPIGNVFNKFTRIVRDLSQKLNKQCELEIKGKDVELDKTIIEGIGDPLTHLIRNAVDHGVETPAVRQKAGKSAVGRIELNAFHQEGKVNIIISDDGAGIDAERLRKKAVEKAILTSAEAEQLSTEEAVRLIFHPGFSTADQISDVSGRGVGMDVVRTNFEQLGGTVDVETNVGKGTRFIVRLPLTLAIIPSLVVSSRGNRYAVPQMSVSELVRVQRSEWSSRMEKIRGTKLLRLRGNLLPLVDVNSNNQPQADGELADSINIVVLNYGEIQFGLIVDALHDTEEIVVKPLGRHIKNVSWLAGATILGDGQIAFIIDVAGLANQKRIGLIDTSDVERQELLEKHDDQETLEALMIANHPDEQFAIPISQISRIEKISPAEIETIDGRLVMKYRGSSLPLLSLERHFHTRPIEFGSEIYIVVCQIFDSEVGLITPEVLDTHGIGTELDTQTLQAAGLLGSTIVNQKTTRVLDIFQMAKSEYPHMIPDKLSVTHNDTGGGKLVLAEDSNFFRSKMKSFLEEENWTVYDFENGSEAWEFLKSTQESFDLVITDIEMPVMDGFEFCQKIRASDHWNHIPVIAVTSLADSESHARSQAVGITEHMIKLDRAKLIETLSRYISHS
ncbi:chemotaxis protein CheW [Rubinisphaera sp.]|uniref:hybrid sensor histidine kinase/response regulator n=2 Tax=Rubinisphaera TaxID=1649490 RepID=UPI000C10BD17|nr:chemotaxis protein CheW [Rubinisphaera sp.]MBV12127.1 chemotaxis protein CheA [Rubinisphaera sp.]HCS55879.1 chemotaxis protein CheA [Planctomycetaceae bacterium]|tara:strand:+ start:448 stop:3390 length:2943 start_codon:yes stop_codon:yes gene_type:complete